MDPALYIDVSKVADANRDVYFETFFMAGLSVVLKFIEAFPASDGLVPISSSILRRFDAPRRPASSRASRTCR